eukprot:m51a1_g953 hypothetical protein (916) ;mRNA; f:297426-300540
MHAKLLTLLALLCAAVAYPAFPGPYDVALPDGSSLRVWARGDEFTGPRYVDDAGRNVYLGADGSVSYTLAGGAPGAPLRSRRDAEEQSAEVHPIPEEWNAQARLRRARFNEALAASASKRVVAPSSEPLVFVLVQYPDFASGTGIRDHILSSVFGASGSGDTINSYYAAQSGNKFHFSQANETSGVANDGVIGPVTINCSWVNQSDWSDDPDYSCLERNALLGAAEFLDLKSFDKNGDGVVSGAELHIVLVVAGGDTGSLTPTGMARCPHVWGFMMPGAGYALQTQNVTFGEHVVIGENWDNCTTPFGIGVLAHELGHTLSLPDLYDQDKGGSILGPWCLMDGGLWNNNGHNPGMISPFLRSYLGWLTPTVVSSSSTASHVLQPVLQFGSNPNGVDWEWDSHSGKGEYFLVENRQQVGCDAYAPGSGVLVWHVNEAAAPTSSHASAVAQVERLQRRNGLIEFSGRVADDVLTSSTRASVTCSASGAPNSLLDNSSTSCVSLSATVNTTSRNALIEPWTDAACTSCVFGKTTLVAPTKQYSFLEAYGFSLISMAGVDPLPFTNGHSQVFLPFSVSFGGATYSKYYISQRGWISLGYINNATTGAGTYPRIAPYAGDLASAVYAQCLNCTAPFPAGLCCAVQWNQKGLKTQAVITQGGDIYYLWSGNRTGTASTALVSTGSSWTAYPGAIWSAWYVEDPLATPVAVRLAPRDIANVSLPLSVDFETPLSPHVWSHVTGGAIGSVCGKASGNSALAFVSTLGVSRNAMTNVIDVSGCANVSVVISVGPSAALANCSPISSTVWFAPMLNTLSPSWSSITTGRSTSYLAIPKTTSKLYLMWNLMNAEGRFYLDDLSVTCKDYWHAPTSEESSSESSSPEPSSSSSSLSKTTKSSSSGSGTLAASVALSVASVALAGWVN